VEGVSLNVCLLALLLERRYRPRAVISSTRYWSKAIAEGKARSGSKVDVPGLTAQAGDTPPEHARTDHRPQ
jgi:hypothetical protein